MTKYGIRVVFSARDIGPSENRTGEQLYNHIASHEVIKVTFHPMYRHNTFHYDIAVLEVDVRVTSSKPIKIAPPGCKCIVIYECKQAPKHTHQI